MLCSPFSSFDEWRLRYCRSGRYRGKNHPTKSELIVFQLFFVIKTQCFLDIDKFIKLVTMSMLECRIPVLLTLGFEHVAAWGNRRFPEHLMPSTHSSKLLMHFQKPSSCLKIPKQGFSIPSYKIVNQEHYYLSVKPVLCFFFFLLFFLNRNW